MPSSQLIAYCRRRAAWNARDLLALLIAAACIIALLAPPAILAAPATPAADASPGEGPYQVTLNVGTGAEYEVLQGNGLDLPIAVSVEGAAALGSATVLVQYDPKELRPVACVRPEGAPGGYCNIAWDKAKGLVRFDILAPGGVLGAADVFNLTFAPAATATINKVTAIVPLLESIADVYGNYMTSWLAGSTVMVGASNTTGPAVYVGRESGPNPVPIAPGKRVTVPIDIVRVTGLGSASFSLAFDPQIVRVLECRPVQPFAGDDRSGACAVHADHVSANLISSAGLSAPLTAFEVVFALAATAAAPQESALALTLGAFADTAGKPITVQVYNNSLRLDEGDTATLPTLRLDPVEQYLAGDQRVSVRLYLDNGAALLSGSWGIRYDPLVVEAVSCEFYAGGGCNAAGEPGLIRMSAVRSPAAALFPPNLALVTFRRHPQAQPPAKTDLVVEVTNFAGESGAQIAYRTVKAAITVQDPAGSPAVAMSLPGTPPYGLSHGSFLDFPVRFVIDPARPLVTLSASIRYDPKVLRPTRCIRNDGGSGPAGYCNSESEQPNGIIRFNLLAESEHGVGGTITPFVVRMEPTSTAPEGASSPLHFTVEAITGPNGVPRTWSAADEVVTVAAPVNATRIVVGPPALTGTAAYTVSWGSTATVPVWVTNAPKLGAGTLEIRYDNTVARATGCTLRSDLTPQLDGGYCSLLPGVVRAAFVASSGIDGDAQLFDIQFAQAPNAVAGQTSPLTPVVDNLVDTAEVPIPTGTRAGQIVIPCYVDPVADLRIARDGANLKLSWTHVGTAKSGYQVWRAEHNAYFAFGDAYSSLVGTVPAPAGAGTAVSYVDTSGGTTGPWADEQNHYYMVRAMCRVDQGSERSNRVGKFTRFLASGWNLVSWPLLVYDAALDSVLGAQLHGTDSPNTADVVTVWNPSSETYTAGWYCGGSCDVYGEPYVNHWLADDYSHSTLALGPDMGFWILNRTGATETLRIVGGVEEGTRSVSIGKGWQLLGRAFPELPTGSPLDVANLPAVGTISPVESDTVQAWDPASETYKTAWYCSGSECQQWLPDFTNRWLDENYAPTDIELRPGYGFWFLNRHEPATWVHRR